MFTICRAVPEDADSILALQRLAYQSEAAVYDDWSIPPLTQTLESLRVEFATFVILKAMIGERIVGSVRARVVGDIGAIGRLIVHPEYQGRGIGSCLLEAIERACEQVARFELFTGSRSARNIRLYERAGYRKTRTQPLSPDVSLVFLEKPANGLSPDAGR